MKQEQKEKVIEYLLSPDIDIRSMNYTKGGNISSDTISINFYQDEGKDRFIWTAEIKPNGKETVTRRAKVFKV